MVEASAVQVLDALGSQQVTIGDQCRNAAVSSDALNDHVQVGMEQGLAAADGDD